MRAELAQQLLATGEMPVVLASATGTMTSHIVGVKDHVLVATITSKIGTSLFSKSEIKSVEDLKGKTVATGRPGAFLDATVRYVLRSKFGLVPDRDVKLLPTGEPYLGLQALEDFRLLVSGLRVGCPGEGLELAEHGRDELRNRRVNVHRPLNDCVRRFRIHDVKDRVNHLVAAGA